MLDGFDFEDAEIGSIAHCKVTVGWIDVAESLSTLTLTGFFHAFDFDEGMRTDVFRYFEGVEDVFAL